MIIPEKPPRLLVIGFVAMIAMQTVTLLGAIHQMGGLATLTSKLYVHPLIVSNAVLEADAIIVRMHSEMKNILLARTSADIERALSNIFDLEQQALERFDVIDSRFLGDHTKLDSLLTLFDQWAPIRTEVSHLATLGMVEQATEISKGEGTEHVERLFGELMELLNFARSKADNFYRQSERQRSDTVRYLYWAMALLLVTSSATAFYVIAKSAQYSAQLKKSEELKELILNAAVEGIFGLDLDGNVIFVNAAASNMTGWSPEQLIGNSHHVMIHHSKSGGSPYPQDECPVHKSLRDGRTRHIAKDQFWRRNGTSFEVELTAVPLTEGGRLSGAIVQFTDITERKAQEITIREQTRLIETVFETIPNAIYWKNLDGVYLGCNSRFVDFLGLESKEQVLGNTFCDLGLSKSDEGAIRELDRRVLRLGRSLVNFEHRQLLPDGEENFYQSSKVPLRNNNGNIEGLVGIFTDITERKRREEAVRRNEALLGAITACVHEAIVVADNKGSITFWNRSAEKIFGYSKDEAIGRNVQDLMAPDSRKNLARKGFNHAHWDRKGDQIELPATLQVHRKNGSVIPIEVSVANLDFGSRRNTVAVIRNISERQMMERRLRQAEKMQSLGSLAGGVAHEINNLLLPTVTLTSMVMNRLPPDSRDRDMLGKVIEAGQRATDLISHVTAFSRVDPSDSEVVDIHAHVRMAIELLRKTMPRRISLADFLEGSPGTVRVSGDEIKTVVQTLVSNSVDAYEGKSGEVTIRLEGTTLKKSDVVERPDIMPGKFWRLTVSDQGKGMNENVLVQAFDPFFTTKEVGSGTGLGLSAVHGIVYRIGGFARIESFPHEGCIASVWFPADDAVK
jgi:PAS domain S-box-containing protein